MRRFQCRKFLVVSSLNAVSLVPESQLDGVYFLRWSRYRAVISMIERNEAISMLGKAGLRCYYFLFRSCQGTINAHFPRFQAIQPQLLRPCCRSDTYQEGYDD